MRLPEASWTLVGTWSSGSLREARTATIEREHDDHGGRDQGADDGVEVARHAEELARACAAPMLMVLSPPSSSEAAGTRAGASQGDHGCFSSFSEGHAGHHQGDQAEDGETGQDAATPAGRQISAIANSGDRDQRTRTAETAEPVERIIAPTAGMAGGGR